MLPSERDKKGQRTHEDGIRDNWKIETKGNNKDPYIQSCH